MLFVKHLSPVFQGIQRSSRETCSIVEGTDEFFDDFVASRRNSRSTLVFSSKEKRIELLVGARESCCLWRIYEPELALFGFGLQYDGSKDDLDWRIDFKYLIFICIIKYLRSRLI